MKLTLDLEFTKINLQILTKNGKVENLKVLDLPESRHFIETKIINKNPTKVIPHIERLCPRLSLHSTLLYSEMIEAELTASLPNTILAVRQIFLSIEKIQLNLFFLYKLAKHYNLLWQLGQLINSYENLLKKMESITGRRYFHSLFFPNYLNLDLTLGKIRKLRNLSFDLDDLSFLLAKLLKELSPLSETNYMSTSSIIYATQNYIQDYIDAINSKLEALPISKYTEELPDIDTKKSISTPRGDLTIKLKIQDNTIKDFEFTTPSATILKNLPDILKGTDINEINENILQQDICVLGILV